jgi:hypothetical protein
MAVGTIGTAVGGITTVAVGGGAACAPDGAGTVGDGNGEGAPAAEGARRAWSGSPGGLHRRRLRRGFGRPGLGAAAIRGAGVAVGRGGRLHRREAEGVRELGILREAVSPDLAKHERLELRAEIRLERRGVVAADPLLQGDESLDRRAHRVLLSGRFLGQREAREHLGLAAGVPERSRSARRGSTGRLRRIGPPGTWTCPARRTPDPSMETPSSGRPARPTRGASRRAPARSATAAASAVTTHHARIAAAMAADRRGPRPCGVNAGLLTHSFDALSLVGVRPAFGRHRAGAHVRPGSPASFEPGPGQSICFGSGKRSQFRAATKR